MPTTTPLLSSQNGLALALALSIAVTVPASGQAQPKPEPLKQPPSAVSDKTASGQDAPIDSKGADAPKDATNRPGQESIQNKKLDPQDPARTPTPNPAINPVKNPTAEQILGPGTNAANTPTAPTTPTKEGEVIPTAAGTAVPVAPPKPATPAEKAAQKAEAAPNKEEIQETAIQKLIREKVFTTAMQGRTTPFSRAEWADVLVKALQHNTTMFELFPFYRDVPRTHPSYVPIEVAREKRLLTYAKDHGYYHPEKAVTYGEIYQSIAQALTGPPPKPEEQTTLLHPFRADNEINTDLAPSIAKMARLRFFVTETGQVETALRLDEPATPDRVAPLLASLMHIIELRSAAIKDDENELASILPGGLRLVVTPSTAVTETQMTPGQRVFFSLAEPVLPLPKESRVRAVVREADRTTRRFVLLLDEIHTPEDVVYRTQAEVVLTFQTKRRAGFIVPGQRFEATTETLPIPKTKTEPSTPGKPKTPEKPEKPFDKPANGNPTTSGKNLQPNKPGNSPTEGTKPGIPAKK